MLWSFDSLLLSYWFDNHSFLKAMNAFFRSLYLCFLVLKFVAITFILSLTLISFIATFHPLKSYYFLNSIASLPNCDYSAFLNNMWNSHFYKTTFRIFLAYSHCSRVTLLYSLIINRKCLALQYIPISSSLHILTAYIHCLRTPVIYLTIRCA